MWAPRLLPAFHSWACSRPWIGMKLREGENLAGGHPAGSGEAEFNHRAPPPPPTELQLGVRMRPVDSTEQAPRGARLCLPTRPAGGAAGPGRPQAASPQLSQPRRRLGRGPWHSRRLGNLGLLPTGGQAAVGERQLSPTPTPLHRLPPAPLLLGPPWGQQPSPCSATQAPPPTSSLLPAAARSASEALCSALPWPLECP